MHDFNKLKVWDKGLLDQGASLGFETDPHPAFGTPLPHERERGRGEGARLTPRLNAVG